MEPRFEELTSGPSGLGALVTAKALLHLCSRLCYAGSKPWRFQVSKDYSMVSLPFASRQLLTEPRPHSLSKESSSAMAYLRTGTKHWHQ